MRRGRDKRMPPALATGGCTAPQCEGEEVPDSSPEFSTLTLEEKVDKLAEILGIKRTPPKVAEWIYSEEGLREYETALRAARGGDWDPLFSFMKKTGNKVPRLEGVER